MNRSSSRRPSSHARYINTAALLIALAVSLPLGAATITVDTETDEYDATPNAVCSLREAVESANLDADFGGCTGSDAYGADTIILPAGTYGLTRTPPESFLDLDNSVGDLDVQDDQLLEIMGAGSATTIVTRQSATPFGILQSDLFALLSLSDLTVSGGQQVAGAGIFADGNLTLQRVVVRDNLAQAVDAGGGGIVAFEGLTVIDSLITANQVDLEDPCDTGPPTTGGGVFAFNFGDVLIQRSTISGNSVTGDPGCEGFGGGLGLIGNTGFMARIVNSTVSGNSATLVGGVDVLFESFFPSQVTGDLNDNQAARLNRDPARWTRRADERGAKGSSKAEPGLAMSLEHATITANSADNVGGISFLGLSGSGEAVIENTLIGNNTAADAPDCSNAGFSITSQGINLLSVDDPFVDESACLSASPNLVGTTVDPVDPLLGPLQNNGGLTPTHALEAGSPAFDAATAQGETEDQRGTARPQGMGFDIGAFESLTADIQVSKSDGIVSAVPGTQITYTVTVLNPGPSTDPAVVLTDPLPAGLTCNYQSTATGGATGNTSSGSGNLNETLSMPAGSSVTYTLVCNIAPGATGTLTNTATVAASVLDPDDSNNSATDDNTLISAQLENIPALDGSGLAALLLALLGLGGLAARRRQSLAFPASAKTRTPMRTYPIFLILLHFVLYPGIGHAQDFTVDGLWDVTATALLPNSGGTCDYEGIIELSNDNGSISGPLQLSLVNGAAVCPPEVIFDLTAEGSVVGPDIEVSGELAGGQLGEGAYTGVLTSGSNPPSGTGSFTMTTGPFAGTSGTWTAEKQMANPTIVTNTGITLNQGATETVDSSELQATDPDTDDSMLMFVVTSGPDHGRLELTMTAGTEITSFSQAQVNAGEVAYIHDGTDTTSDRFLFDVEDGAGNNLTGQAFDITINQLERAIPTLSGIGLQLLAYVLALAGLLSLRRRW